MSCDIKYCTHCNPEYKERMKTANEILQYWEKYNEGEILLKEALKIDEFTVPGELWRFDTYLRKGYYIEKNVQVTFIKSDERFGILQNGNSIWIYHNGTKEFSNEEFPQLCPYFFDNKNRNGAIGPDKDVLHHVKIMFKDTIFEDWVHDGGGVIIKNKDLKNKIGRSDFHWKCSDFPSL